MLHVSLLGPPEVRLGRQTLAFATRKTVALLAYLAVEGGEQPRERLAALLWPEASPERSFASLRTTLGHLQGALRQASGKAHCARPAALPLAWRKRPISSSPTMRSPWIHTPASTSTCTG